MSNEVKPEIKVIKPRAKRTVKPSIVTPVPTKVQEPISNISNGGKYKVNKKCYIGMRIYKVGDIYESTKGEEIPDFFSKVRKYVEVED